MKKILVVEDSNTVLNMLKKSLQSMRIVKFFMLKAMKMPQK